MKTAAGLLLTASAVIGQVFLPRLAPPMTDRFYAHIVPQPAFRPEIGPPRFIPLSGPGSIPAVPASHEPPISFTETRAHPGPMQNVVREATSPAGSTATPTEPAEESSPSELRISLPGARENSLDLLGPAESFVTNGDAEAQDVLQQSWGERAPQFYREEVVEAREQAAPIGERAVVPPPVFEGTSATVESH